jgi:hypothetical protein
MSTKNNYSELLSLLKERFESNMNRHKDLKWEEIQIKLEKNPNKLESLFQMEKTGGEPDVVGIDEKTGVYIFYDCSPESPKERRSFCYDKAALDKRKENKPKNNAVESAKTMGIEILAEEEYSYLQTLGNFDAKTSSWLKTPEKIRKLGGAIFADFRFDTLFVYHNGAESYYAGRGFRGVLKV